MNHPPEPWSDSPTPHPGHTPVMLEHVLHRLDPRPADLAVDCTVGLAGHALPIFQRISPGGRLIGLDADPANLCIARERFPQNAAVDLIHTHFAQLPQALASIRIPPQTVNILLADLGICSTHLDQPERGFSFQADGPLDMRLSPDGPRTAADLLETLTELQLADLIYKLGDEPASRRIARAICTARAHTPIQRTAQLARIVEQATGYRNGRTHPATRTFQALRIAVNDELQQLQALLEALPELLAPGARVAIISFHSLEDRLVKQAFRNGERAGLYQTLDPRPAQPVPAEVRDNPRARSAKLRAIRKLG